MHNFVSMKRLIVFMGFLLSLCGNNIRCFAQDDSQDTILMMYMKEVQVTEERQWANDTLRYRYNQMRHYVKMILPYLNEATRIFNDVNAKMNDPHLSKRERKKYISEKEDLVHQRFDEQVKKLNETQGVLLVKLIARQTGSNLYTTLQEFKNPLTAVKWQAWARLHGFNLNKKYDPNNEPWLEQIMDGFGYPLPDVYKRDETALIKKGF